MRGGRGSASRLREALSLHAYRAGWAVVRYLPAQVAYRGGRVVADLATYRGGRRVRRLRSNLARVLGEEDSSPRVGRVTKHGMRSYVRYWVDAFRLADWDADTVRARVRTIDEPIIREALARGRGVVVPLPHMANWDLAGAWATIELVPVTTVAERLKPEALYDQFVGFRERLGMTILPLTGGDTSVTQTLADHLREGGLVCLVADRDLSRHGVDVEVAGHRTRMPAGPALLAKRTGAALVPATLSYEGSEPHHRMAVRFHPPIEVNRISEATQAVADVFTTRMRENPEDWHMLQRYFLADLVADDPRLVVES